MTEETQEKPKPYHHGDLRNALIVAGRELLAEEGLSGLDLRKVARRAGVSHSAPYRHFADKQTLLAAIAEDGCIQLGKRLQEVLNQPELSVQAKLHEFGKAYLTFALESPSHMREMFGGLISDREDHPTLYKATKEIFWLIVNTIEAGQIRGEIVEGDPKELMVVFWSLIHGMAMLIIDDQIPGTRYNPVFTNHLLTLAIQSLCSGIAQK